MVQAKANALHATASVLQLLQHVGEGIVEGGKVPVVVHHRGAQQRLRRRGHEAGDRVVAQRRVLRLCEVALRVHLQQSSHQHDANNHC
jgi:hypothetical protein